MAANRSVAIDTIPTTAASVLTMRCEGSSIQNTGWRSRRTSRIVAAGDGGHDGNDKDAEHVHPESPCRQRPTRREYCRAEELERVEHGGT